MPQAYVLLCCEATWAPLSIRTCPLWCMSCSPVGLTNTCITKLVYWVGTYCQRKYPSATSVILSLPTTFPFSIATHTRSQQNWLIFLYLSCMQRLCHSQPVDSCNISFTFYDHNLYLTKSCTGQWHSSPFFCFLEMTKWLECLLHWYLWKKLSSQCIVWSNFSFLLAAMVPFVWSMLAMENSTKYSFS